MKLLRAVVGFLAKHLRVIAGVVVAALTMYFLYKTVESLNPADVWEKFVRAEYWWIIPGVAVYFLAVGARTWRWHYLLRPLKSIPLRRLFPMVVIGYMGNNIYPARAGEVLRSYVLKRQDGVSISASLATVLIERIFDGVVMLLFVFIALPLTPNLSDEIRYTVIFGSLAFFGALVVFLVLAARPADATRLSGWAIQRLLPERFREKALSLAERFLHGLASLRRPRDVLMVFVTSVVIWLTETVKYWFVMHAFRFQVDFYVLMLMNGVVNLATTIPTILPGYIGTFDVPGIKVLALFGVPEATGTAYTVVLHAALWLPPTLLGAWYMARMGLSWRKVQAEWQPEDAQPTPPAEGRPT